VLFVFIQPLIRVGNSPHIFDKRKLVFIVVASINQTGEFVQRSCLLGLGFGQGNQIGQVLIADIELFL